MNSFMNCKMSWKRVITLSLLSASITALFNCIPFLDRTSFTAPAETLEMWIVLALFIVMNCNGYKDAMTKTFVFFLISQPLIYLLEVPFKDIGWNLFRYYRFWGIMTVLTIPGAAIAYRVKKDDILSALILSVANLLTLLTGFYWLKPLLEIFPRYLIAVIFCFTVPFLLSFLLLRQKKSRITALFLIVVFIIVGFCTQNYLPA